MKDLNIKTELLRPKTRGELVDALRNGIECEVVATNEETTTMLITNWLNPPPFTTRPSENKGWVVYTLLNEGER